MLPPFELLMPQTLPEALDMLGGYAPDALPVAGGTNLIPDMRGGKRTPGVVVNVAGLEELEGIRREDGYLVIGSGVTIAELLESSLIDEHAPVLRQAAEVFANPLVRNRATVGGNLGNASPAADAAPPLLVLDAEVKLVSAGESRWVPLEDFFVGVCDTICRHVELMAAIRTPVPAPGSFGRFRKLALRKSTAISVVSVAVQMTFNHAGRCEDVAIALGAVAPTPIRAYDAEAVLRGEALTPQVIEEATRSACDAARCIGDVRSSAGYRERVTGVLVRRLLEEVGAERGVESRE
ncbi:MAG: xanthine dehydrogenase family protein subunit M [Chloroflexota bacterium]|nr:xanthine dehydrogenase family protein subunit M [Chloroflexota bacterium]